jgi:hypothetical protein
MACSTQCTSATRIRVSRLRYLLRSSRYHPFYSHPTEPQCSYDPVEGLPLAADADPIEKIRELEEQVGSLLLLCDCTSIFLRFGSHTLEETEITEGQHFAFSIPVSQSLAPPFQSPP